MNPEGFREGDIVLLEQRGTDASQALWTDGQGSGVLRITQQWEDGEEATVYLCHRELEEIAAVASGRSSVQRHEDYLDAQERHDDATI